MLNRNFCYLMFPVLGLVEPKFLLELCVHCVTCFPHCWGEQKTVQLLEPVLSKIIRNDLCPHHSTLWEGDERRLGEVVACYFSPLLGSHAGNKALGLAVSAPPPPTPPSSPAIGDFSLVPFLWDTFLTSCAGHRLQVMLPPNRLSVYFSLVFLSIPATCMPAKTRIRQPCCPRKCWVLSTHLLTVGR